MSVVSERAFQTTVINLAKVLGWKVGHFHDSRRQIAPGRFVGDRDAAGMPDLVLVRERVVWAELKTTTGRLSRAQRAWVRALEGAGAEVYVWRPDGFEQIQQVLQRREGLSG